MFRKIFLASITSILLILSTACNLARVSAETGDLSEDATAVINTRVAELVAATDAAQTAIANVVESTLAENNTPTPATDIMPPAEPTQVVIPSLEVHTVSVSAQTNCRAGPGTAYEILDRKSVV
jgi:hypothetical protein